MSRKSKGKRYTDKEKAQVLAFVEKTNDECGKRPGRYHRCLQKIWDHSSHHLQLDAEDWRAKRSWCSKQCEFRFELTTSRRHSRVDLKEGSRTAQASARICRAQKEALSPISFPTSPQPIPHASQTPTRKHPPDSGGCRSLKGW